MAAYIRIFAFVIAVFLINSMTFQVESLFLLNFNLWKSDRICDKIEGTELPLYDVDFLCRQAVPKSVGGSCDDVEVELESISTVGRTTRDVQLAVCVINDKKSNCLALGFGKNKGIVFNYVDGKCQSGITKRFKTELDLI